MSDRVRREPTSGAPERIDSPGHRSDSDLRPASGADGSATVASGACAADEPVQVAPERILTPANVVTVVRIALVPVFVLVLLGPWADWLGIAAITEEVRRVVAAGVFIAISATDWLDGYLARSRGEVTNFGKFMDPLADKILVAAALLALIELGTLPTWVVLIILTREFIVSGVRMMAAAEGVVIAASYIGKFKTVSQMTAIVLFTVSDSLIASGPGGTLYAPVLTVSWVVMAVALVLTVVSMVDYVAKARDIIGLGRLSRRGRAADAGPEGVEDAAPDADRLPDRSAEGCAGAFDVRSARTGAGADACRDEAALAAVGADALAQRVIDRAVRAGVTVGTAESLTGGLIAGALTGCPGSSSVVKGGIVSYRGEVKHAVLGVSDEVLAGPGAVSEECALQMCIGARAALGCDVTVAVTGIAGPGGAEPGKPVGTVWLGACSRTGATARLLHLDGDRATVRARTVAAALGCLLELVQEETTAGGADADQAAADMDGEGR
ncbi:CDP-diacylglycerol--glycerol-3-phosphate 3-phosphatidyltransferase [Berryella wangjianweii]|uniref:CDP-diacylglycerol--glycerol-3-phosphate 3-phosphatidyltransferase n=1 Tax=Berryella wangjianweii TaxID=2734634 RepID=UPI0036F24553